MNRIEMFTASQDLRVALHRVAGLALAPPWRDHAKPWWHSLPVDLHGPAARAEISLDDWFKVLNEDLLGGEMAALWATLRLARLDRPALAVELRRARISRAAHRQHLGRDVYGAANKALWDRLVHPLAEVLATRWGAEALGPPTSRFQSDSADPVTTSLASALVQFRTGPGDPDHRACATWLGRYFQDQLGFTVTFHDDGSRPPLIEAHRAARGRGRGHVALYGHYDTVGAAAPRWNTDPDTLAPAGGRWYARGISDNKGPLAARLAALSALDDAPALTWLLQGEEETGAGWARTVLPDRMNRLQVDLWLDETGYHDADTGTLRLLARRMPPRPARNDAFMDDLLGGLRVLATRWGVPARTENRGLNKTVVLGGCPFDAALPPGAAVLALGVNDTCSGIHAPNESIPTWTLPLHAAELAVIFHVIARHAEAAS